jgi:hypothetical protein
LFYHRRNADWRAYDSNAHDRQDGQYAPLLMRFGFSLDAS